MIDILRVIIIVYVEIANDKFQGIIYNHEKLYGKHRVNNTGKKSSHCNFVATITTCLIGYYTLRFKVQGELLLCQVRV